MPSVEEIIWAVNAGLLSWILRQYFKLRKDINDIRLELKKNEFLAESIEKLFKSQEKILETIQEVRSDQATMFERIERYHEDGIKEKRKTIRTKFSE